MGEAVKEPAAGDSTQLAIGWQKGSKRPNISIFLPKSMKVRDRDGLCFKVIRLTQPELQIDIGPRFRSDRFELQVGALSARFVGGFQVRLDDQRDWLQFQLAATVDPKEIAGEL